MKKEIKSEKRLAPSFTVTETEGRTSITINYDSSPFFRFCINSSRLYWQKEFEGKCLTDYERAAQERCLLAKLYAIGLLLHPEKDPSKPCIVWVHDLSQANASGKTFFIKALAEWKNVLWLAGRNKRLTENQYFLECVDEETDIVCVDDAVPYFDFDYFYAMATVPVIINKKHSAPKQLDFRHSPKVAITANFVPSRFDVGTIRLDESMMRRILFVPMSDYYQETRRISDDFGHDLFGPDYTTDEWNADINFLIDCLQFFSQNSKP